MSGRTALQRVVAGLGLLLMVPIGVQLVQDTLTPVDAATRAVALLLGVAVARMVLTSIPGGPKVLPAVRTDAEDGPLPVDATVTTGRRRIDPDPAD